jgi:hypothetical protein
VGGKNARVFQGQSQPRYPTIIPPQFPVPACFPAHRLWTENASGLRLEPINFAYDMIDEARGKVVRSLVWLLPLLFCYYFGRESLRIAYYEAARPIASEDGRSRLFVYVPPVLLYISASLSTPPALRSFGHDAVCNCHLHLCSHSLYLPLDFHSSGRPGYSFRNFISRGSQL